MSKKALIAMSGGVDSSVAAYLMQQQGYECTGVMMKLFDNDGIGLAGERSCCSAEDAEDARNAAYAMGMPFYVYNMASSFKEQVIGRFVRAYQNGATPNPCIDCNRYMKFEQLFLRMRQLEMDCLVTGHYAVIERDAASGRYILRKAKDEAKDQSYVLCSMTQDQLAHTALPLGGLHKTQVRKIAGEQGFVNAKKRDSQDICFVPDGDYAAFIEQHTGKPCRAGDFIDTQGNILGRHKGLIRYTIGQRKGLGLSFKNPLYVSAINTGDNTVTLCEEQGLYSNSLTAADFNWIAYEGMKGPARIKAKIRYSHPPACATATQTSHDTVRIDFDTPQRAITKGQAAVLYDGDKVIGGGLIT